MLLFSSGRDGPCIRKTWARCPALMWSCTYSSSAVGPVQLFLYVIRNRLVTEAAKAFDAGTILADETTTHINAAVLFIGRVFYRPCFRSKVFRTLIAVTAWWVHHLMACMVCQSSRVAWKPRPGRPVMDCMLYANEYQASHTATGSGSLLAFRLKQGHRASGTLETAEPMFRAGPGSC